MEIKNNLVEIVLTESEALTITNMLIEGLKKQFDHYPGSVETKEEREQLKDEFLQSDIYMKYEKYIDFFAAAGNYKKWLFSGKIIDYIVETTQRR